METLKLNGETTHKSQLQLRSFIAERKNQRVVTNIQIGSALMDVLSYPEITLKIGEKTGMKEYEIGQIGNTLVFVDPMMKWDDTRIICDGEEILIDTNNMILI